MNQSEFDNEFFKIPGHGIDADKYDDVMSMRFKMSERSRYSHVKRMQNKKMFRADELSKKLGAHQKD